MKKLGADLILGRKSRVLFKRNPAKTIRIKANIPSGQENRIPILGQYGIQAEPFMKKFVELTQEYKEGAVLPTDITILPSKQYIIKPKVSSTYYVTRNILPTDNITYWNGSISNAKLVKTSLYTFAKISNIKDNHVMANNKNVRSMIGSYKSWHLNDPERCMKKKFNYKKKK